MIHDSKVMKQTIKNFNSKAKTGSFDPRLEFALEPGLSNPDREEGRSKPDLDAGLSRDELEIGCTQTKKRTKRKNFQANTLARSISRPTSVQIIVRSWPWRPFAYVSFIFSWNNRMKVMKRLIQNIANNYLTVVASHPISVLDVRAFPWLRI